MVKTKLIVCGSIALDRIMNFSGQYKDLVQPDKLESFSISMLLDELKESPGGTGANIAYNLALLGERPTLVGAVGANAENYIQRLADMGVNTKSVHFSDLSTASFNVINDSEGNQVGGFYPGAMSDSSSLSLEKYKGQEVFVVVSAHDPKSMRAQVAECREYNLRLFYDVSQQVSNISKSDLKSGIDAAEIIIVNDYEMALLCKKTGYNANDIRSRVPVVITTHGSRGSIIEGTEVRIAAKIGIAKPKKVLDPTGAGDGYRGGFLYGYVRGWDLQTAGELGATAASFVVEQYGSQVEYNKEMVSERYRDNFKKEVTL